MLTLFFSVIISFYLNKNKEAKIIIQKFMAHLPFHSIIPAMKRNYYFLMVYKAYLGFS